MKTNEQKIKEKKYLKRFKIFPSGSFVCDFNEIDDMEAAQKELEEKITNGLIKRKKFGLCGHIFNEDNVCVK